MRRCPAVRRSWIAASAVAVGALVAGPLTPAQSAISYADSIAITYQVMPNGVRYVATGGEDLPAFVGEETLLVDFSTPTRVKFKVLGGKKLLEFAVYGFGLDTRCETPEGATYVKSSELSCFSRALGLEETPSSLSPSTPTLLDFSAISSTINVVVVDGTVGVGNAYPAIDYRGGAGADYVQGGKANDSMTGGPGNDSLFGGPGDDDLYGAEGNDDIDGEEGDDRTGGGPGDDYVVGGPGYDYITGGSGVDEVDSEDGLADPMVACDNDPGLGKVWCDDGKDIPFDCPALLLPGAPEGAAASGSRGTLAVDWAPPSFDGNSPITGYQLTLSGGKAGDPSIQTVTVDGDTLAYEFPDLPLEDYMVAIVAINEVGKGPVAVARATVTKGIAPPVSAFSTFVNFTDASLQWVPPIATDVTGYEIALRATNRKDRKWGSWVTLPGKYGKDVTSAQFGPDLKLVRDRRYQFRVRALDGKEVSPWTTSQVRFASPIRAPKVVKTSVTDKGYFRIQFDVEPAKALKYNGLMYQRSELSVVGGSGVIEFGDKVSYSSGRVTADFAMFGSEENPQCSLKAVLLGPDLKTTLATPSTRVNCWFKP